MLRLVGLAISIGLADSLNPSTIAPALYLASGERAQSRVTEFTIAVFLVYLLGGAAIALGPGQLLLSLVPHPHHRVAYIIEAAIGVAMLAGAALVWRHREHLARRAAPDFNPRGKSSFIMGATITAVELPTAFPYFAVIAAIVGSGLGVPRQLMLLVLFNLCFVLPLVGIVAVLTFARNRSAQILGGGRRFLERHWPVVLAAVGLVAGAVVIVLGITGLAASRHNRVGRFFRGVHRLIHP